MFCLLVYHFCPRPADVGVARFLRTRRDAVYGKFNGLARQTVKFELIAERPVRNSDDGCEDLPGRSFEKVFMGIESV